MRRTPRSRGSASSDPPDAYTTAIGLLGQRELSEAQLRERLLRRGCSRTAVDETVARLAADRTLDDRRVAAAAARMEARIRGRGPARVRQRLRALGIADDLVQDAVAETFTDVDQGALIDAALDKRLRGRPLAGLDERDRNRLIRALVAQGFAIGEVLKKVRA